MKRKNVWSRTLAIVLTVLLMTALGTAALAANTVDPDATYFTFTDDEITVTEGAYDGYKIEDTALTINAGGTYVVSGTCADGSIKVKKGTTGVTLVLDGLTLTSADTAPISCNKSTQVTILAAAGTVNTLTDSEQNNDDDYPDNKNAENAVIKCKDGSQVTIGGTGTIIVNAYGKNGVKGGATTDAEGEAWLTIQDVKLVITAHVNDALKSDQELNILSGSLTISAADDAIKSDYVLNIGAEGTEGPTILITDSYEGIEAATLNVYSGNITVNASDDGMNAANSDLEGYSFSLNLYGGKLTINAQGDGVDSNGTLTLGGADLEVYSSSQNDNSALDCDGAFTLTGGTVLAVGTSGMAQTPNTTSQYYVTFGTGGMGMGGFGSKGQQTTSGVSLKTGDTLQIVAADGTVLYTAQAVRDASWVFFTSPDLTEGETVTLKVNGSAVTTATASNTGSMGGFGGPGMGGFGGGQGGFPGGDQSGFPGQPPMNEDGSMPAWDENELPAMGEGQFPGMGEAQAPSDQTEGSAPFSGKTPATPNPNTGKSAGASLPAGNNDTSSDKNDDTSLSLPVTDNSGNTVSNAETTGSESAGSITESPVFWALAGAGAAAVLGGGVFAITRLSRKKSAGTDTE